jgi:hypothetical protein
MPEKLKIRNVKFIIPADKHIFNPDDVENSIFSSISNIEFDRCSFIWKEHVSDENFSFINVGKETANTAFYGCYFKNPKKPFLQKVVDFFNKK